MTDASKTPPTLTETALGGFFQDIGKFVQRAHGAASAVDKLLKAESAAQVRGRESVVMPTWQGRPTHRHVFWTDAFFQWMEDKGLSFPRDSAGASVNLAQVRRMAVHHHRPDEVGALGWLAAEADRLSSGMDREKRRDGEFEADAEGRGWNAFIRTAMVSPFSRVNIGLGAPPERRQPLAELVPGGDALPRAKVDTSDYQSRYAQLWKGFAAAFGELVRTAPNGEAFESGLLALSERFTFAVPSSTVDLPDISLHDHNRTVAAIAACMHAWHAADSSLDNEAAVRDRATPKYRLLAGDLSGIQSALFTLASEQVKGVNRILRARSFMMGALLDGAALLARRRLGLPVFNVIQNAGGRFVLLVPALPEVEAVVDALRGEVDAWMRERYFGALSLNLALSPPFGGEHFHLERFPRINESLTAALEDAKQRALGSAEQVTGPLSASFEHGACPSCGQRPATVQDHRAENELWRCRACHDEHELGSRLPRARLVSWHDGQPRAERRVALFGGLYLALDAAVPAEAIAGYRPCHGDEAGMAGLWPIRYVANYVPLLGEGDRGDPRYDDLSDDALAADIGDAKTFEHLQQDALEIDESNNVLGKPFLAVLKADVDRLGFLFGHGLDGDDGAGHASIGRLAGLSRMVDFFFSAELPALMRSDSRFRSTYTVYAGGDDLLLIGPWRQTIALAGEVARHFHRYTGENPNITLSAGIELTRADQPLNRSVRAAERRLERAKQGHPVSDQRRNRVSVIADEPFAWADLAALLERAEQLCRDLRGGRINTALLYRLRYFDEQRRKAEQSGGADISCADWRARWGYALSRLVLNQRGRDEADRLKLAEELNAMLGLDASLARQAHVEGLPALRVATDIALYRNRH